MPSSDLQIECGYQFTQKLEGMFVDIKVSTDTMDLYKTHVAQNTVSSASLQSHGMSSS